MFTIKNAELNNEMNKVNVEEKIANRPLWQTRSATIDILNKLEEATNLIQAQQDRIKELENMAMSDEMTKLSNRRAFEIEFDHERARTKRLKSIGGILLLIDLDKFKPVNDTYGHLAGDACLKLIGKTLNNFIRDTDTAARIGGDEFAVLLSDTDLEEASPRIHDLFEQINSLKLKWDGEIISIGASIGFAGFDYRNKFEESFKDADEALYLNKQNRRKA